MLGPRSHVHRFKFEAVANDGGSVWKFAANQNVNNISVTGWSRTVLINKCEMCVCACTLSYINIDMSRKLLLAVNDTLPES